MVTTTDQESTPETTREMSKRTLSLPETVARKEPRNELTMPLPQLSMMETIANKLNGEDASECLLQLARVFRQQSALCLQQAERLDRMAAGQEEGGPQVLPVSGEALLMQLQLQNVSTLVEKSADMMIQSQQMLDSIENRLAPFGQKAVKPKGKGAISSYAVFYQENYASLADRLKTTTKKVLAPEMGNAWRALSKDEKDVYVEKAREISRERREKRDASAREKKSAK